MGECEEVLPRLAGGEPGTACAGIAFWDGDEVQVNGGPQAARFVDLPPLAWPDDWIARHHHHHHRFDAEPGRPRRRGRGLARLPLPLHLLRQGELPRPLPPARRWPWSATRSTRLIGAGRRVRLLHRRDLPAQPAAARGAGRAPGLQFGVQTRIDLWKPEMLELLGRAGCVSIEAGVESLTARGPRRARQELPARRPTSWPSACSRPSGTCRSCRPTCSRCRRTMPG